MSYELHFHPLALKEWKKISKSLQDQFKKMALQQNLWVEGGSSSLPS